MKFISFLCLFFGLASCTLRTKPLSKESYNTTDQGIDYDYTVYLNSGKVIKCNVTGTSLVSSCSDGFWYPYSVIEKIKKN